LPQGDGAEEALHSHGDVLVADVILVVVVHDVHVEQGPVVPRLAPHGCGLGGQMQRPQHRVYVLAAHILHAPYIFAIVKPDRPMVWCCTLSNVSHLRRSVVDDLIWSRWFPQRPYYTYEHVLQTREGEREGNRPIVDYRNPYLTDLVAVSGLQRATSNVWLKRMRNRIRLSVCTLQSQKSYIH
jgi:hypothetical protein